MLGVSQLWFLSGGQLYKQGIKDDEGGCHEGCPKRPICSLTPDSRPPPRSLFYRIPPTPPPPIRREIYKRQAPGDHQGGEVQNRLPPEYDQIWPGVLLNSNKSGPMLG